MNAVLGSTEMLLEEADGEVSEDLQRIHRTGSHLLSPINDVLDLSKIEAGQLELSTERVALLPVLHDVLDQVGRCWRRTATGAGSKGQRPPCSRTPAG